MSDIAPRSPAARAQLLPYNRLPMATLLAVVIGAAASAPFSFGIVAAYRSPAAHLVLETAEGCVALLVAYLLYGRFVRTGRTQDFLLLQGLVLLALAGIITNGLLIAFGADLGGALAVWLPLAIRSAGVLFITAAALVSPLSLTQRKGAWTLGPAVVVLGGLSALFAWQAPGLPPAVDSTLAPSEAFGGLSAWHPLLSGTLLVTVLCFGVAAVAFSRQAPSRGDELLRWLGPACVLAMLARLNYLLFPSLYSDWLYAGDLLRVGFFVLLLVGAAKEIRQYWASQAHTAVREDRRRLARELHDGLIQEIGYIRAESCAFLTMDASRTERVLSACDRALDEARQAVEALGQSGDEPLGFALHRAADQVANRYGVALELDINDTVQADLPQRHALLRILREAIANAARHGRAQQIRIELTRDSIGRRLVVTDDGAGFDVDLVESRRGGFGLISMRERAQSLPGECHLASAPGAGATVTVNW